MWSHKKSVTLSLVITYIFMVLLLVGIIALPSVVTWYVEIKGREPTLPKTIMLTCYPCVPFAAIALWSLRCLLRNIRKGLAFCKENTIYLNRLSWCCFAVAAVMLFSGQFYLPFFVAAIAAAFLGLLVRVIKNLVSLAVINEEEKQEKASEITA